MELFEIYVSGDPYDTVWADSADEAVEFFRMDYPGFKEKSVTAYHLFDDELWLPEDSEV